MTIQVKVNPTVIKLNKYIKFLMQMEIPQGLKLDRDHKLLLELGVQNA